MTLYTIWRRNEFYSCVSEKAPFYTCDNVVITCYPILLISAGNLPGEICSKTYVYIVHHTWFILLKLGTIFIFSPRSRHRGVSSRAAPLFIASDLWPPNSPELNPVDYSLHNLGCDAGARLLYADTRCCCSEAVPDCCVFRSASACHRRGDRPVAWTTARLCKSLMAWHFEHLLWYSELSVFRIAKLSQ